MDFKLFFKKELLGDVGSICVFMNRCGKINVKVGFMVDYNAYKDFYDREFEVYVIVFFMIYVGMEIMEGILIILC